MQRPWLFIGAVLFLVAGAASAWRVALRERSGETTKPEVEREAADRTTATASKTAEPETTGEPVALRMPLTMAERAARVEQIKRDYDEMRVKVAADYTAAGALYPESVPAFLRQLALLEREKKSDLVKVLSPDELEALEWRETTAGQRVQQWLGDTLASEEQRRAVFRLQRDFDERFALSFDVVAPALLERESARQDTQRKIRGVLGEVLFAAWLRSEGEVFTAMGDYVARSHLPAAAVLALWDIKNEFARRELELRAGPKMADDRRREARARLVQQIETQLANFVGREALATDRAGVFGWLPER